MAVFEYRGILIGTSRANPGKKVRGPRDLEDPERTAPLMRAKGARALVSLFAACSRRRSASPQTT